MDSVLSITWILITWKLRFSIRRKSRGRKEKKEEGREGEVWKHFQDVEQRVQFWLLELSSCAGSVTNSLCNCNQIFYLYSPAVLSEKWGNWSADRHSSHCESVTQAHFKAKMWRMHLSLRSAWVHDWTTQLPIKSTVFMDNEKK